MYRSIARVGFHHFATPRSSATSGTYRIEHRPRAAQMPASAADIGSVAAIRGLNYRVFTDIERARNWLMK